MRARVLRFFPIAVAAVLAAPLLHPELLAAQPAPPAETSTTPAQSAGLAGPTDAAELEAFLDGWLAAYLEKVPAAGATVSVVRDGKVLLAKGYGFADLEGEKPVEPDRTLFRIGSVSKLFVWTSVMQLVEQGKVDLDTDVNDYLTDIEVPAAFGKPVTLANLLTHTAGFEDRVVGLFAKDETRLAPIGEILKENLPERVREPGNYASYSNHGTGLAMLVVEQVSGVPWMEYVDRNIIGPLALASTTFEQPLPERLREHMSKGYRSEGGELVAQDFEFVPLAPVGAVSSTATDMARLMLAYLGRGALGETRILGEETATRMMSELHRHAPEVNPMAHGMIDSSLRGVHVVGHGGDTLWFHTAFALFPEHDLGLFLSFNTQGANPYELLEAFTKRYFPAPAPAQSLELTAEQLARFAGAYRANRYDHTQLSKLGALFGAFVVSVSEDGKTLVTSLDRKVHWVPIAPLVFQERHGDQRLVFRERDGEIESAFLSDLPIFAFERTPAGEGVAVHATVFAVALTALGATLLFWPLAWLARRHYRVRLERGRRMPAGARWLLFLAATLLLTFLLGTLMVLSDPMSIAFGVPRALVVLLALPVIAVPLLLAALYAAFRAWRGRQGTWLGRGAYTLVVLAGLAFVWQLWVWNLLGWRY